MDNTQFLHSQPVETTKFPKARRKKPTCSCVTYLAPPAGPCIIAWSLKSRLHPTSNTGMLGPHNSRTSSIHLTETLSSESGVSSANAIRMTCDLE